MPSPPEREYLDIGELCAQTGLSRSTIHRLKRDGKIAFVQPAGKRGRVLFRRNAIELPPVDSKTVQDIHAQPPLRGRRPKWMK